ncbi:capsule assembly Wzi family protein [Teredinibacter franksiae]|uniref:capsule assembly Wzi family protein n=1 Tax=Teredinibacter franksiae TaxID=2761453 RepID=UPI0016263343|nr:capsule assembly Wzi family protein [Teredinibacter franksiae]
MFKVKSKNFSLLQLGTAVALLTASCCVLAEPWVPAGDERTRHHLQVLADSGELTLPLTAWPVMWSGIKSELDAIKVGELSKQQLWSYRYLRHALEQAMRTNTTQIQLRASTTPASALTGFDNTFREGSQSRISTDYSNNSFALKIQHEHVFDTIVENSGRYRYDGSYIAGTLNNWVIGAGAIDRWWGPGWQSSLILSNNARPTPGIFLKRKDTSAHTQSQFWQIGWDLSIFLGAMTETRAVENARLSGARLSIKPFSFLELGVSSTQMSGKAIAPAAEEADDNATPPPADAVSDNNLQAFDWRLGKGIAGIQAGIYQQQLKRTGDALQTNSQETANLTGVEFSFTQWGLSNRLVLEQENTRNGELSIFDHPTQLHGYRRYGRNMGPAMDTASEASSFSGSHYLDIGHQFSWRLGKAKLNNDNIALEKPAGHPYGNSTVTLDFATIKYNLPITDSTQLEFGLHYFSTPLTFADHQLDSGGYIHINISL